jgi:ribosome-associated toxin RatA of RatAB toxin-antitoxin module
MRFIKNEITLNMPVQKVWNLLSDVRSYPKYFKYVNKVTCKDKEIKLDTEWYDFATFILPVWVKHTVTVFEREKSLGFDVKMLSSGFIRERFLFMRIENGNATKINMDICFDFRNPILSFLLDGHFEKRLTESVSKAILKLKKELEVNQ